MKIICILFGVLVGLLGVVMFLIVISKTCYVYIFEHEDYELWNYYIAHADEFEYSYSTNEGTWHTFVRGDEEANVWEDGMCSIHNESVCILCSFFKRKSKKMAELLMSKVK